MTPLQTLLASHPLTTDEVELRADMHRCVFACRVKDYAHLNDIGDSAFDSVESLMDAIEAHLKAKNPPPLTEKDVEGMRWKGVGRGEVFGGGVPRFIAASETFASMAADAHNADVDRLWREVQRLNQLIETKGTK